MFYVIHHIVVKTTLFLVSGLVELRGGTGRLAQIGGFAKLEPFLAVLFLVPALSLAGIPPFSGFVAKLALVEAGLDAEEYAVVAVSLLVSLLTLFSMTKIWTNAFWGSPLVATGDDDLRVNSGGHALMTAATAALVALSIAIAVAAGPLYRLSERAAADVIDPSAYIESVLGS